MVVELMNVTYEVTNKVITIELDELVDLEEFTLSHWNVKSCIGWMTTYYDIMWSANICRDKEDRKSVV